MGESTNMKISVDRQSICIGDDMESHKKLHEMSDTITFLELFNTLIEDNYFPYTGKNNIVWVLRFNGKNIIAWKTKKNNFYEYNKICELISKNGKRIPEVTFIYYSSVEEWEEKHVDGLENKGVKISWFDKLKLFFINRIDRIIKQDQKR